MPNPNPNQVGLAQHGRRPHKQNEPFVLQIPLRPLQQPLPQPHHNNRHVLLKRHHYRKRRRKPRARNHLPAPKLPQLNDHPLPPNQRRHPRKPRVPQGNRQRVPRHNHRVRQGQRRRLLLPPLPKQRRQPRHPRQQNAPLPQQRNNSPNPPHPLNVPPHVGLNHPKKHKPLQRNVLRKPFPPLEPKPPQLVPNVPPNPPKPIPPPLHRLLPKVRRLPHAAVPTLRAVPPKSDGTHNQIPHNNANPLQTVLPLHQHGTPPQNGPLKNLRLPRNPLLQPKPPLHLPKHLLPKQNLNKPPVPPRKPHTLRRTFAYSIRHYITPTHIYHLKSPNRFG